jgi:hypothetical protein
VLQGAATDAAATTEEYEQPRCAEISYCVARFTSAAAALYGSAEPDYSESDPDPATGSKKPHWLRAGIAVAVSAIMAIYSVAKLMHLTVWDNPYTQQYPEPIMPALQFSYTFNARHGIHESLTFAAPHSICSLPPMTDKGAFARAELFQPVNQCINGSACSEGGRSISFPGRRIVMRPDRHRPLLVLSSSLGSSSSRSCAWPMRTLPFFFPSKIGVHFAADIYI